MSPIPSIHTEEFDLLLNEIAADDCVREDDFVSLPMSGLYQVHFAGLAWCDNIVCYIVLIFICDPFTEHFVEIYSLFIDLIRAIPLPE